MHVACHFHFKADATCGMINRNCCPHRRVIALVIFVTFCVAFPLLLSRVPFTLYFSVDNDLLIEDLLQENRHRYNASVIRLKEKHKRLGGVQRDSTAGPVDVVFAIVSVRRTYGDEVAGYLTQVAESVYDVVKQSDTPLKAAAFICDVYAFVGNNTETEDLRKYLPVTKRFDKPSSYHVIMDVFEKEKQDYVFCLTQSLLYNAKYVILVEDDAVLEKSFTEVLHSTLQSLRHVEDFVLKLFYPPRWQGFAFERRKIFELLTIGLLSCCWALFGHILCLKYSSRHITLRTLRHRVWRLRGFYAAVFIYGVCVALAIGRQNLLELRRLSPLTYALTQAHDCCSPAILYPRHTARALAHFLFANATCSQFYAVDAALDSFTRQQQVPAYLIEPNVVRHIGLVSSIKSISRYPEDFIF